MDIHNDHHVTKPEPFPIMATISVGIAMFGYSNTFKLDLSINFVRLLALMIFVISLLLCITNIMAFKKYIKILERDKINLPNYIDIDIWKKYLILAYLYAFVLMAIIIFGIIRAYNNNLIFK